MAKKKPANSWAARLHAERTRLKLTQAEAAERAGVAVRTWISWENQQRTPGRLALRLLKEAFPNLEI